MSSIIPSGSASGTGSITLIPVNTNNNQTVTFPDASGTIAFANQLGMRNRIINGAMVIDQRNAGAATANTINGYTVDRWIVQQTVTGKLIAQQNAGSVTPPAGFNKYLGVTSQSAYSVAAGNAFGINQLIEGFNIADLGWGTANAKSVTLSFWVYSSLTGTFGGSLSNNSNYSYPFSYTISSANTWEQKTINVSGPTSGTWASDNSAGISLYFGLGVGSIYSGGTAGSWSANYYLSPTGATSVVGTNGATFYITGVQLEVGTQATNFEYRQYGQELALCQRYFEQSYDYGIVAGAVNSAGCALSGGPVGGATTGYIEGPAYFKVTKRASPTILNWDLSGNASKCNRTLSGVSSTNNSVSATGTIGTNSFTFNSGSSANANIIQIQWTASAEL